MIRPSPHASRNYYMGGFCHTSCCMLVSLLASRERSDGDWEAAPSSQSAQEGEERILSATHPRQRPAIDWRDLDIHSLSCPARIAAKRNAVPLAHNPKLLLGRPNI